MTRLDYRQAFPESRHRFAQAGSRMAIDNAPIDVRADGDEPVVIDCSATSMLQVLASELLEANLLIDFVWMACNPRDPEVQTRVLPRLRSHERIQSALSLTWTAETARDVAGRLEEAADVAESEPDLTDYSPEPDRDLHLSGLQP